MSKRPIPIDELLKDDFAKPTYIPKSKRSKLEEPPPVEQTHVKEKRLASSWRQSVTPSPRVREPPRIEYENLSQKKATRRKFQFDWDESEDTTLTPASRSRRMLSSLDDQEEDELERFVAANDPLLKDELSGHWSSKQISQMTERDWRIFNEEFSINYRGGRHVPHAIRYWQECDLEKPIVQSIQELGYTTPTPIQRASIPISLQQRDVVGVAETGSGKTLAYLLPIFQYLSQIDENFMQYEKMKDEPLALVLAPTRELALQITAQTEKLCLRLGYSVVSIIGGHQYQDTVKEIEEGKPRGVDIIVGTPGRLLDSIDRKLINLQKCYYLVLDEADRMIDLGFERDLHKLITYLPNQDTLQRTIDARIFHLKQRINSMFTATISPPIEKLTKSYLKDPIFVTIGGAGEALENIDQKFEYLPTAKLTNGSSSIEQTKLSNLLRILQSHKRMDPNGLIIVFANFKNVVDTLSEELDSKQFPNVVVHGSKSQDQRESALEQFKSHDPSILVATDVAARGIDIPQVSLVVNFQMPHKFEEYIHRIGRTGRAGHFGTSITFIDDDDAGVFLELKKFLSRGGKKVPEWLYRYNSTTIKE
ncbi:PRP28 [Candida theae]|uniref:RNA helicase n=1 Tax=Candida theae TaxID=1198502 RepID=A0AAD5BEM3_9ASCO|nr:PRP28 [Candida theae]KAI5958011.1 PRP28 [Candida theae]